MIRFRTACLGLAVSFAAAPTLAETPDDGRLRQIAGQSASYAGEARALLAKGANPNLPDNAGRTAVHGAARIAAADTMRALLGAGGKPNVPDEDGNTPLHFAAAAAGRAMGIDAEVAAIRLLLGAGGDPNRANAQGRTPLHAAAAGPLGEGAVQALVAGGGDPDRKDRAGDTPLHAAVGPNLGRPGVVGAMLRAGGNPRATNGDGLTVLQLLVRAAPDMGDTAAMLIGAGADPDRRYSNGDTMLHAAIRRSSGGFTGIALALLDGGADPCIRGSKNYTPYEIAKEGGIVHTALDRANGHDLACSGKGPEAGLKEGERAASGGARAMQARTRVNVRSGPGTQHGKVGLLEAGQEVTVTGEAGEWARIEGPQGGEAFVHASFLVDPAAAAALEPKCAGMSKGARCWVELANMPGCYLFDGYWNPPETATWSGQCADGVAVGQGTWGFESANDSGEKTGALVRGKRHGHWVERYSSGFVSEGSYADGKRHGRRVQRYSDGSVFEGSYVDGKLHGRWIVRKADGTCELRHWNHGKFESFSDC